MNFLPYKLDGYNIIECLGDGGFSSVYKVNKNSHLDSKPYRLKFFLSSITKNHDIVDLLIKKWESLAHNKDNPIFCYGYYNRYLYVITQYLEGVTLDDLLKDNNFLSKNGAESFDLFNEKIAWPCKIIFDICCDLSILCSYLRESRDGIFLPNSIQPSNILIKKNGTAQLLDIFTQVNFSQNADDVFNYLPYSKIRYIPPEFLSDQEVGLKSNIYSLGVLLFELLLKENLFHKNHIYGMITNILNLDLTTIKNRLKEKLIPDNIIELVLLMLSKKPQKRPYPDEIIKALNIISNNNLKNVKVLYIKNIDANSTELSKQKLLSNKKLNYYPYLKSISIENDFYRNTYATLSNSQNKKDIKRCDVIEDKNFIFSNWDELDENNNINTINELFEIEKTSNSLNQFHSKSDNNYQHIINPIIYPLGEAVDTSLIAIESADDEHHDSNIEYSDDIKTEDNMHQIVEADDILHSELESIEEANKEDLSKKEDEISTGRKVLTFKELKNTSDSFMTTELPRQREFISFNDNNFPEISAESFEEESYEVEAGEDDSIDIATQEIATEIIATEEPNIENITLEQHDKISDALDLNSNLENNAEHKNILNIKHQSKKKNKKFFQKFELEQNLDSNSKQHNNKEIHQEQVDTIVWSNNKQLSEKTNLANLIDNVRLENNHLNQEIFIETIDTIEEDTVEEEIINNNK